jgi:hypothetical protein
METKFQRLVNNSFLFRLYLLKNLPLACIAGVRAKTLDEEKAVISVKFKWITQNPFRSMYFAVMAMAAEMSTGLLIMNEIFETKPSVSMLIVGNQASYHKKAVGNIQFTCNDGNQISQIIQKAKQSGEAYVIEMRSVGMNESGEKVAEFIFTWSVKAKSNKI